ncbi:MAG: DNA alkylation repair protein [Candidatus Thiodiazotropha endolucinida]
MYTSKIEIGAYWTTWPGRKVFWERRIAIISTLHFIKKQQYEDTLRISRQLLDDTHDLIHKAVGWMLREVGNRDLSVEQTFLHEHYQSMPRTMLRYAIERFPQKQRKAYLNGQI